jgi:hypothetical protein
MFTSRNWFLNILCPLRLPYFETRQLYWEDEILSIFQREPYGNNVIVFIITFRESRTRSTEYDFNIHMILMKNWAYLLFIINLEINILTHYLLTTPLLLTRLFFGV